MYKEISDKLVSFSYQHQHSWHDGILINVQKFDVFIKLNKTKYVTKNIKIQQSSILAMQHNWNFRFLIQNLST